MAYSTALSTLHAIAFLAVGAAVHVPACGGEFDGSFSLLPGESP